MPHTELLWAGLLIALSEWYLRALQCRHLNPNENLTVEVIFSSSINIHLQELLPLLALWVMLPYVSTRKTRAKLVQALSTHTRIVVIQLYLVPMVLPGLPPAYISSTAFSWAFLPPMLERNPGLPTPSKFMLLLLGASPITQAMFF